jgi:FxsC-like protein
MSDALLMPQIITFYSYKGGTGRSMALANVAWILASNGKRVLLLDWDLEAPGLHRYFHPFLRDKTLESSEGVIDFVTDFAFEALAGGEQRDPQCYVPHANILRYAFSLVWNFPSPGTLDFVPAGRQGPDYATRVNSFNWESFYRRLGGGLFLEAAKKSMAGYDYVLIDSRTGVSDTAGVCTVQMPDRLVVCFTLNSQSIEGAAAVAHSAQKQRQKPNGDHGLRIFPVPTRVDLSEKEKLELANDLARERFDPLLWHLSKGERDDYWSSVRMLYHPFYAYEEVLATFGDKPKQPQSVLLPSMEALTGYITDQDVRQFPPLEETNRIELLESYLRKRPRAAPVASATSPWLFYLSYDHSNRDEYVERFFADLTEEVRLMLGLSTASPIGFLDTQEIRRGRDWPEEIARALRTSRMLVCLVSPGYVRSSYCGKEVSVFQQRLRLVLDGAPQPAAIMPITWVPLPQGEWPETLNQYQRVNSERGIRHLMRLRKSEDDYREIVSRLAERLVEASSSQTLPLLDNLAPLDEVPSAFDAGPNEDPTNLLRPSAQVECVFVVALRAEIEQVRREVNGYGIERASKWCPFLPAVNYDANILAAQTAALVNVRYSSFPFGPDLPSRVEKADSDDTIIIMVVDAWTLMIQRYLDLMQDIDRRSSLNSAVLVVWGDDAETSGSATLLDSRIRQAFPHRQVSRDSYFRGGIRTVDGFRTQFIDAVTAMQAQMIERARVLRPDVDPLAG